MSVSVRQRRAGAGWSPTERRPRRATWGALVVVVAGLVGLGCKSGGTSDRVELVVFAASSLTEAFTALEHGFERAHPEIDVQLSFAGSQISRVQIEQGAGVDVFASANEDHVQALADAGLVAAQRTFAHNELVVIVPTSDAAQVASFDQLDEAERLVIGTATAPIGAYTRVVFERAGAALGQDFAAALRSHVVSEESNVRLVRAKVALGEADAAIVYRTDAAAEGVRTVEIPAALNVRARYPIAVLAASRHPSEAAAFLDYVSSAAGQEILAAHGFIPAEPADGGRGEERGA